MPSEQFRHVDLARLVARLDREDGLVNLLAQASRPAVHGQRVLQGRAGLHGVLGRMAAYSKKPITRKEMMAKGEKLDAKLKLPANGPDTKN